ncbi:nuclear transport factor 2 family protein [Thermodesulfobacteriota bacterium]
MDEKVLQEMLDERAIKQTMYRYLDRIDANDPEGAAACFAEDGVGKYWGDFKGRKAIAERLTRILDMFASTSHHISNISIKLKGDTATALSYAYAFHRMTDSGEPMHFWGRWVDRFVKTGEGWLFSEKEVVGVGSLEPDGADKDRNYPGHPGRIQR